jgi:hypothetical protein
MHPAADSTIPAAQRNPAAESSGRPQPIPVWARISIPISGVFQPIQAELPSRAEGSTRPEAPNRLVVSNRTEDANRGMVTIPAAVTMKSAWASRPEAWVPVSGPELVRAAVWVKAPEAEQHLPAAPVLDAAWVLECRQELPLSDVPQKVLNSRAA